MAEARQQQAAAAAAAQDSQRAQQLAEASRGVLAELERALDAREMKLQDSWKALTAQLTHIGGGGAGGRLLHSDHRLRVGRWSLPVGAAGCKLLWMDGRLDDGWLAG